MQGVGLDADLSFLDHLLEQVLQPVGRSRPRKLLGQLPSVMAHLLRQPRLGEQASDQLGVSRGIVGVEQISARAVADD